MIGFFDSGLGGLTIFKEVSRLLPDYRLLYLADTARSPYGNRSQESIYKFTEHAVDFLFKQGCELVIIACNTASAEALRKIQQEWLPAHYPERRVLGVIRPIAEEAARLSKTGRIGLVGTRATVNSKTYERELGNLKTGLKLYSVACPLLVPLIEEGMVKRPETIKILRNYVRPLKAKKIDTLIMGCTHYQFLHKTFIETMGKNIKVIDSAKIVAEKLADYLKRHQELEKKIARGGINRFLLTDLTENFKSMAERWLGQKIELEKIEL